MQKADNTAAKGLGFGYLFAAVIFLCNPCLNIIDILPDFFGYCFLIAGLNKWADLCPNIAEAVRNLSRLRWFMLLKLLAIALVPLVDNTYVLLFTFGFVIIESIYVFPSIGQIFDGVEYFGTRFDSKAAFRNLKNVRSITYITVVIRYVFVLLPELCELSSFEYSGYVTATPQIDVANYKGMLIVVNIVFGVLACVLWLINVIPYLNGIRKDTHFLDTVMAQYENEIVSNKGIGYSRCVRSIFTLIIAGSVFIPNLWIDGFNVIPTLIGGTFFIAATLKLCRANGSNRLYAIAPAVFTIVSAVSFAVSVIFASKYTIKDVWYDFGAYDLHMTVTVLSVIEYVCLAVCAFFIGREVLKLVKIHLAPDLNGADDRISQIRDIHLKEAVRRLVASFVLLMVIIAINAVYAVLRADIDPGFYLVGLIAAVAWVIWNASTLNSIYSQIEYKYM